MFKRLIEPNTTIFGSKAELVSSGIYLFKAVSREHAKVIATFLEDNATIRGWKCPVLADTPNDAGLYTNEVAQMLRGSTLDMVILTGSGLKDFAKHPVVGNGLNATNTNSGGLVVVVNVESDTGATVDAIALSPDSSDDVILQTVSKELPIEEFAGNWGLLGLHNALCAGRFGNQAPQDLTEMQKNNLLVMTLDEFAKANPGMLGNEGACPKRIVTQFTRIWFNVSKTYGY